MRGQVPGRQPGQIIVLAAVVMVAMVGMLAFAVDAGIFLETRRELQNAADSGALAGVVKLPNDAPGAHADGIALAETNAARIAGRMCRSAPTHAAADGTVAVSGGVLYTLTVTSACLDNAAPGYTFGRILGLTAMDVQAGATAAIGSLKRVKCPAPFGVEDISGENGIDPFGYEFAELVVLRAAEGSSGNWHTLDLDGDQAGGWTDTEAWLEGSCEGIVPIGSGPDVDCEVSFEENCIYTQTGATPSRVADALDDRGPNPPIDGLVYEPCSDPAYSSHVLCKKDIHIDDDEDPSTPSDNDDGDPLTTDDPYNYAYICTHPFTIDTVNDTAQIEPNDSMCQFIVPIIGTNFAETNGSFPVPIVGFGVFLVEGYIYDPPYASMAGYFIKKEVLGEIGAYNPAGPFVIRLIR